jgi:CheY-like chemotaxis protein
MGDRAHHEPDPGPPPVPVNRPRILLAEDERVVRVVIVRSLEEAGYSVVAVENGWEAWREAQNHSFHLLVTDHLMPMMGGKHLVQRVRGLFPQMPVILISGNFLREDTPTEYPADIPMLSKPFENEVLISEIRRLLNGELKST